MPNELHILALPAGSQSKAPRIRHPAGPAPAAGAPGQSRCVHAGRHHGRMAGIPEPWPLRGLVLRTPRLELRPDDDDGLRELVALAHQGIHDPAVMPFHAPWTDAPAA